MIFLPFLNTLIYQQRAYNYTYFTYNRKTILDDDDEDTSSEDGTEESDFGEGNSRSSTRYLAIEKM